jgi:hypothetical protein
LCVCYTVVTTSRHHSSCVASSTAVWLCPVLLTPRCPLEGPLWISASTSFTFLRIWVVLDLPSANSQWCSSTLSLTTTELVSGRTKTTQIVQPRSKVKAVLAELHRWPSGGHLGVNKTRHSWTAVLLATLEERCWEVVTTLWHLHGEPRPQN